MSTKGPITFKYTHAQLLALKESPLSKLPVNIPVPAVAIGGPIAAEPITNKFDSGNKPRLAR